MFKIHHVLCRLPQIRVNLWLRGVWAKSESGQKEDRVVNMDGRRKGVQKDWIQVHADQEYVMKVELSRVKTGNKVKNSVINLQWYLEVMQRHR